LAAVLAEGLIDLVAESIGSVRGITVGWSIFVRCRIVGWVTSLVAELVGHGVGVANVLGASNATFSYVVRFAVDLRCVWEVGGRGGRANLEDWGLPVVTLQRKLLVLRSLGRDTTWKVNIREDGVLLGHGHVDLSLVCSILCSLCLLLALQDLLLDSLDITAVDVLCLLWILQCLLLSTISLGLDLIGVGIELIGLILDGLLDSLLEDRAENLKHDWLGKSKQQLMPGLLELDVEVLDVNLKEFSISNTFRCMKENMRYLH
jgi:hypothetical protein